MKSTPKEFLNIGKSAEFVIRGKDCTTIISGGVILKIKVSAKEDGSGIVICTNNDLEHSLFTGSLLEAVDYYQSLTKKIAKTGRRDLLSTVKSLSIISACIVITSLGGLFLYESKIPSSAQPMLTTTPLMQNGMPISPDNLPSELSFLDKKNAYDTATQESQPQATMSELKVIKKPDFLEDVVTSEPISRPTPSEAEAPKKTNALVFPAYNPSFGQQTSNQNVDNNKNAPISVEPTEQEGVSTPNTSTGNLGLANNTPAAQRSPNNTEQSLDEIANNAENAISSLIGNGMDNDGIRKILMELQALKAAGSDDITPEMLQSLPEEIAAMLIGQGIDIAPTSTGTMRILPSEVVDQFRGPDGVATIPENYSWYARSGGPISIPLPGGGDIKTAEDMLDFGFQP